MAATAGAQLATMNYFPLPNGYQYPFSIVAGPDGAMWFTGNCGYIGRIDMLGNTSQYEIPYSGNCPWSIAPGPDGNLWFTDNGTNSVGRVCAAVQPPACSVVGQITEYPVRTPNSYLAGITAGPDGALWFTELNANNIGRITTAGSVTEYPAKATPNYSITAGPDGALWFTERGPNYFGRITTAGSVTQYPTDSSPSGITAGPDGALWFVAGSQAGRITTGTDPTVTEFDIGDGVSDAFAIAAGADGALWTLNERDIYCCWLGRITTGESASLFDAGNGADGIASGPDGAIWIAFGEGLIGQAIPSSRRDGVDLSVFSAVPTPSTLAQFQQAGVQYAVIEGSQQGSTVPLQQLNAFSGAGFKTAAYCFLYFDQAAGSGTQQAQNCLNSISGALSNPSFVAVDVEVAPGHTPVCPTNGPWTACVQIIKQAIQTLSNNGVDKIVVYTNQGYWDRLTGGDTQDFSSYPLWNAAHGSFTGYVDPAGNFSCATTKQERIKGLLPTSHGGTGIPSLESPATITAFSITDNVVTFTAANTFVAKQKVSIGSLAVGTFLNGKTLTVLGANLSSSQFTAKLVHKDVANTSDSGTATFVLFGGWQVQAGTQYDIGANGGACLFGVKVDFDVFDPALFQ